VVIVVGIGVAAGGEERIGLHVVGHYFPLCDVGVFFVALLVQEFHHAVCNDYGFVMFAPVVVNDVEVFVVGNLVGKRHVFSHLSACT